MKTWTEEETAVLIQNYNKVSNTELRKLIPDKSKQGIYKKAYKIGIRKAPEIEFINRSEARRGEKSSTWNGGKRKTKQGYIQLLKPAHPRADKAGYVMEHIAVWEDSTGFQVPPGCCIHHLNGDKADNRIENLCLMSMSAHTVYHHKGSKRTAETRKKISDRRKGTSC